MTLNQQLDLLADDLCLSEEMKKDMEDMVDNIIGTEAEGYQNVREYREMNIEKCKPIIRVLKDRGKYEYFKKLIQPYAKKGVANLLSLVK